MEHGEGNAEGLSRMSKLPCWAQIPELPMAGKLPQHHPAVKSWNATAPDFPPAKGRVRKPSRNPKEVQKPQGFLIFISGRAAGDEARPCSGFSQ